MYRIASLVFFYSFSKKTKEAVIEKMYRKCLEKK